jgi:hypothetical protein
MAKYLSETEYWQVKATGEIMEVPAAERSMEWMKAYRRVRLFHQAESECVIVCDYYDEQAQLNAWQNMCDEVDIGTWKYWKMIYDNPDI